MSEFAVIKTGSKQYKVAVGDIIKVEKLPEKEAVEFTDLLSDKKVKAKIVSNGKLSKVRVYKFHRRKRYQRNVGHRQPYSQIEIISIK